MFLALAMGSALAQSQNAVIISIKGFVFDEFGNPLYNALLVSENEANQYITNPDGSYDFQIRDASNYVTVSYPGFHNQVVTVADILDGHENIVMKSSGQYEDELVDMVHHKVRKNLMTGSVSWVNGEELQKSPSFRLQEAYMGRILGLGSLETNASPCVFPESGNSYDP